MSPERRHTLTEGLLAFGRLLIAHGHPSVAEPILQEALQVRQRMCTRGHWQIAEAQIVLGTCLAHQGKAADAQPLLLAGQAGLSQSLGADNPLMQAAARYLDK
jgi:hypothetical protein